MSSGDVALELTSTNVVEDDSSRSGSSVTQKTKFEGSLSGSQTGTYAVELTRATSGTPTPETFFDSTKSYKITFTEV